MVRKVLEKVEGKFEYSVDIDLKVLYVFAEGKYSQTDGVLAFQAFSRVIQYINPKEYIVELLWGGVDYVEDDYGGVLVETFQLYLNEGFPKVRMEAPTDPATAQQLQEAIDIAGLSVELL